LDFNLHVFVDDVAFIIHQESLAEVVFILVLQSLNRQFESTQESVLTWFLEHDVEEEPGFVVAEYGRQVGVCEQNVVVVVVDGVGGVGDCVALLEQAVVDEHVDLSVQLPIDVGCTPVEPRSPPDEQNEFLLVALELRVHGVLVFLGAEGAQQLLILFQSLSNILMFTPVFL